MTTVRRRLAPLVLVVGLLAGGSVTAACTTSPSGGVELDPMFQQIIDNGELGSFLSLALFAAISQVLVSLVGPLPLGINGNFF